MGILPGLGQAVSIAGGVLGATTKGGGHTHFEIADVDVDAIREIRAVAAARICEKRAELEALEAELEVIDQALEECSATRTATAEATPRDG